MIKLAIFDMDGTVFDSHLDWKMIREELKIPHGASILEEIYKNGQVDRKRLNILEDYERANTLKAKPIKGMEEFLFYLKKKNISTVLLTNNNMDNTSYLLAKYKFKFDLVITREKKLWKPSPDAFFYIMDKYQCHPNETISLGDSYYDINASASAGISQIFIIKNTLSTQMELSNIVTYEDYCVLICIVESILFA